MVQYNGEECRHFQVQSSAQRSLGLFRIVLNIRRLYTPHIHAYTHALHASLTTTMPYADCMDTRCAIRQYDTQSQNVGWFKLSYDGNDIIVGSPQLYEGPMA